MILVTVVRTPCKSLCPGATKADEGLGLFIIFLSGDLVPFSGQKPLHPTWQKRADLCNTNVHWLCIPVLNVLSVISVYK